MNMTATDLRRGLLRLAVSCALCAAAATVAAPAANAAPCTAAGLADTVSTVTGAAAAYLNSHPDADQALTAAGTQAPADAQASLKTYFATHPQEFADLRGIAQPLTALRAQCNSTVSPGQISALLQAFAS
jgi:heme-binding protein